VNVPVTSSNTAAGTISTSPVVYHAGDYLLSTNFTPVGAGTSNISLGTPGGFSTPAPTSTQQVVATVTAPPISIQTSSITTGNNLAVSTYGYLSQTPTTPVTVTITSSVPAVATVSNGPTTGGAASITFPNTVSTSAFTYYVQGQSVGTTVLTITAPGYANSTVNVTVDPSGFVIYSPGNFSTTTFSSSTSITLAPAILTPGSLTVIGYASLNPGIGNVNVPVSSSATQYGTVTSPVTYTAVGYLLSSTFQPVAAGTTTISIGTPAGFSTPTPVGTQQIVATVTAPPISVQTTSITTGANLEVSTYAYLSQTPPSPVTVTVTSNDASKVTLSTSPTSVGVGSLSFTNTSTTSAFTYYIQGHATGTTTLTLSAPGYSNATINITVDPSGFVIYSPGNFSTTTFSTSTSLTLAPAILTPGSLTVLGYASLSPGAGSPSITVTSSNPAVGTVTSPVTYNAGDYLNSATFQPTTAGGTTNLSISTPAGFSTPLPSSTQQITATVTAPPISLQTTSITTGANLQVSTYAYLSQTPPSAETLTITSSNPSVAVVSKSATSAGAGSISYTGVSSTAAMTYYIQGLATGTSTITVSAPGFSSATISVTVDPSGFVIYSPGNFSTTTFSAATSITLAPAILTPGTLTVLGYASVNPGVSVNVPVTSSVTSVGTVTSPVAYTTNGYLNSASFQPVNGGSTVISITEPNGFSTPSQSSTMQVTATVTAPPISVQTSNITTGAKLQVSTYVYLSQTPPSAVTLTLTSSNPTVATLSASATTTGTTTINYTSVSTTAAMTYYVQGLTTGTSTITISAPGFANATVNVTVDPSGFVIYSPGNFSTTTTSADTSITIAPAILSSGVLTVLGYASLNPGIGTVNVPIGSTSTQIGTVSPTSISYGPNDYLKSTTFHPVATGTTDVVIVSQPSGFTTPSQPTTQQIVVTVQ
jgi:HSP20 family molecular chaperone IbpA